MVASKEEVRKALLDMATRVEHPVLAAHSDADGIYSAALLRLAIGKPLVVRFPREFGDVTGQPSPHAMVDMRPTKPNWPGICVDHHLPHPEPYSYLLWGEDKPTGLLVWELFKDKIPAQRWWLACGAATGDGQAALVPPEIFDSCPLLVQSKVSKIYGKGDFKLYMNPIYRMISSPVNNLARCGNPEAALKLVLESESPLDLLRSEEAERADVQVKKEIENILAEYKAYEVGPVTVVFIEVTSEMNVCSLIASKFSGTTDNVIVIDELGGYASARGDLTSLMQRAVSRAGLKLDGHAGYMGGSIVRAEYTREKLLRALDTLVEEPKLKVSLKVA